MNRDTKTIISFDTPWVEIVEAARAAPWTTHLHEPAGPPPSARLSPATLKQLIDAPYCAIIDQRILPPLPVMDPFTDPAEIAPPALIQQRAEAIRIQAATQGMPAIFNWKDAALCSSPFWNFSLGTRPSHRQQSRLLEGGDETDLTGPLHYRLHRPLVPQYVLVMTDSGYTRDTYAFPGQERMPAIPGSDLRTHIGLHETFHAVQTCLADNADGTLIDRAQAERDAENGALIAMQTHLGQSRNLSAAMIIQHTLAAALFYSPIYKWWPGLPTDRLEQGPVHASMAVAAGLYAAAGEKLPQTELLQVWAHAMTTQDYQHYRQQYGNAFNHMYNFIMPQMRHDRVATSFRALAGLQSMGDRITDHLPAPACTLAGMLLESADFVCPTRTGQDGLRRRVQLGANGLKNGT